MSLSKHEARCLELLLPYLDSSRRAPWRIERLLDDEYPNEPTPDVLLTNGADCMAVEIKRLTDGDDFSTYHDTTDSLRRRLAPDGIRSFSLLGPPVFKKRLARKLVRQLRREIAIAATGLGVGESTVVPVRRAATVRLLTHSDTGFISCCHAESADIEAASPLISGAFFLEDADYPDHRFVTNERRTELHRALQQACDEGLRNGSARVKWHEEWDLHRHEDVSAGEGGVLVTWGTAAFLEAAAIESVAEGLRPARGKFENRKWAAVSAAVLHAGEVQGQVPVALLEWAVQRLGAEDVHPLDLVYLVGPDRVREFDFTASTP